MLADRPRAPGAAASISPSPHANPGHFCHNGSLGFLVLSKLSLENKRLQLEVGRRSPLGTSRGCSNIYASTMMLLKAGHELGELIEGFHIDITDQVLSSAWELLTVLFHLA